MLKRHKQIAALIAVISLFVFTLTGCGIFGPKNTEEIDPPPVAHTMSDLEQLLTGETTTLNGEITLTSKMIYLLDANGYVVPVSMHIPYSEAIAQQVLNYMVKGGPVEMMLPLGFQAPLPEGTTFTMDIANGVATVDFNNQFAKYDAENERAILDAVTWALTEFATIQKVKLQINGVVIEEMPVAKTPMPEFLSRNQGINLEMASNAMPGRTTAVTLYFEGEDATGEMQYYVPVTRLIPRSDDVMRATLEELIRGPKIGSGLVYSLLPGTQVLSTFVDKDVAIANFDEMIRGFSELDLMGQNTARGLQSVVLSLAATQGVSKVHIMVNGKAELMTDTMDFTQPVTVPKQINSITF